MFETIRNAWKIPELRKKLFYTIVLLVVFRLGSVIPVPFVSREAMQQFIASSGGTGTLIDYLDTFSGGAFSNATIFAMSISPYITSSIIMQLLTIAIPALERLQKEGEEGRKQIAKYTRFVTILLGAIQAIGLYLALKNGQVITQKGALSFFVITLSFTAGTAFLMWLGEQINDKGIGNGISMLIFAGIISRVPSAIIGMYFSLSTGATPWYMAVIILVVAVAVIAAVVFMTDSERRVPVQYAKRVVGRKMYGGQNTHIPVKLLAAGVIPIIFASSILMFPATIAQFFGKTTENSAGFLKALLNGLSPKSWVYAVLYFLLIIFFTYFYTAIQFNPVEIANNIKKNGGFVPGIRPGKPTSDYLMKILTRITLAGAFFLGLMAILPTVLSRTTALNISIGGTSLLIVVGVALETVKQMESHMLMRHYKGFLE